MKILRIIKNVTEWVTYGISKSVLYLFGTGILLDYKTFWWIFLAVCLFILQPIINEWIGLPSHGKVTK